MKQLEPLYVRVMPEVIDELNKLALVDPTPQLDDASIQDSIFLRVIKGRSKIELADFIFFPHLTHTGFVMAAKILATSPSLTTLDMSSNGLGEYAIPVIQALATSPSLTTLDMRSNGLGEHAIPVIQALATARSLRILNIQDNNLDKTAIPVAQAVATSLSLHTLYIRDNLDDALPVVKTLATSCSLHTLHITECSVLSSDLMTIARIVTSSQSTLRTIYVSEEWWEHDPDIRSEVYQIMDDFNGLIFKSLTKALLLEEGGGSGGLPVKDLIAIVGEYAHDAEIVFEDP